MIKKKLLVLGLACIMVLSLTACTNPQKNEIHTVITPTKNPTSIPGDRDEGPTKPTEIPTVENEVDKLTDEEKYRYLFSAVKRALPNDYLCDMQIPTEYVESMYGISSDLYDSFYGENPMIGFNPDMFLAFHAAEGKFNSLLTDINNYVTNLKENGLQYPVNAPKMPAMTVYTVDEYIFVVATFGHNQELDEADAETVYNYVNKNVQTTIDIIKDIFVNKKLPDLKEMEQENNNVLTDEDKYAELFGRVFDTLGDQYFCNMEIIPDYLLGMFGIDASLCTTYYGEMPMVGFNPDVLLVLNPIDEKYDEVLQLAKNYVDMKVNDPMQYPSVAPKMPAMTVYEKGEYIFIIATFGDLNNMEATETEIYNHSKANVDSTIAIINELFK